MDNLFLINGDDELAKSEALEKIKSKYNRLEKGVNFLQFDKDNLSYFESELDTYSLFAEDKLLIVKAPNVKKKSSKEEEKQEDSEELDEADETPGDWLNDDLKDKILNKIESITVVFIENGKPRSKLFNFISKNGKVITCEQMKPAQIEKWVIEEFKDNGYDISSLNAEFLVSMCGSNKMILMNEIQKLIDYVDTKEIKLEDINALCVRTPEVIVFELTDCLGAKNTHKALAVLDELLNNKEPIQKVLIVLAKHFRDLLMVRECINQRKNATVVLDANRQFLASKYMNQARNFTFDELMRIFKEFVKLDVDSKVGLIDTKIGLQKILLR